MLNNECCKEFKEAIRVNEMTYELIASDNYWRNIAEKVIQTAKSHVILVPCGYNPNFPMHLWNLLIPQMEIQLNLLW